MDTFHVLYNIQMCDKLRNDKNIYCNRLVKYDDDYHPLKNILDTEINEIRLVLYRLFILENKAIVCKGIRYLQPIIAYAVFINNILNGSIEEENSEADIFDELFKTESNKADVDDSSFETIIERLEKSVNNNNEDKENPNHRINRSKEEITEMHVDLIEKIKTIVQFIRPFAREENRSYDLHELYKVVASTSTVNVTVYHELLLYVFKQVNSMYKTECHPDADVAVLLKSDYVERIRQKNYTIAVLAEEVDRLSMKVQEEFGSLFVKFFPLSRDNDVIDEESFDDVSIVFFHLFNKRHQTEIWTLIGDEIVTADEQDRLSGAAVTTTTLNGVVPDRENEIAEKANKLFTWIENSVKCRGYMYVCLMVKLHLYTVRVLAGNARSVRRLAKTIGEQNGAVRKYVESAPENRDRFVGNRSDVFKVLHNGMQHLETADDRDVVVDTDGVDADGMDRFGSVLDIYAEYDANFIQAAVETVGYVLNGFETEFRTMLYELWHVPRRNVVETSAKWYEWVRKMYERDCSLDTGADADDVSSHEDTLNDDMIQMMHASITGTKVTLGWTIKVLNNLYAYLKNDLSQAEYF